MSTAGRMRLGKLLVQSGIITEEQLEEALANIDGRSLPHVLDELGFASEADVARIVADSMAVPFIDLGAYEVDPNAAALISSDFARRQAVLPIRVEDDESLLVAMADPANIFAIDDLRILTGKEITPAVVIESDLAAALERFAASQADVDDIVGDLEQQIGAVEEDTSEDPAGEDSAVAKLMNNIVTEAIRQGAGDIFIEPQEREMRVRYRIDGVCREIFTAPRKMHRQLVSRLKIRAGMDIAEKRLPQDGRFGVVLDGKTVDLRVAVLPVVSGELVVMRLLQKDSIMMSLEDLGFLESNLRRLQESLSLPYGSILVTGPTGSGKSTTLYAAINETVDDDVNLITVEDPVEYRLPGLAQVQVNVKAGLTFASALRSILRQDPDTVMIGEIRDRETGIIAIEAALTGHLVLSTLHTNDAPSALTRLTEMGVEPFLSASAVTCVIAQRLARRLCPDCKEDYTPSDEALARVDFPADAGTVPRFYRARGCKRCNGIGYRGRMGLHEVLVMSETIEQLTVEKASADDIRETAIAEGMKTLRDDGFEKVKMGLTSIEEVMRVVV